MNHKYDCSATTMLVEQNIVRCIPLKTPCATWGTLKTMPGRTLLSVNSFKMCTIAFCCRSVVTSTNSLTVYQRGNEMLKGFFAPFLNLISIDLSRLFSGVPNELPRKWRSLGIPRVGQQRCKLPVILQIHEQQVLHVQAIGWSLLVQEYCRQTHLSQWSRFGRGNLWDW